MDALTFPYWQTVSANIRQLMSSLGEMKLSGNFYLAEGTALALQIGHRRSNDLDFFSETDVVDERSSRKILSVLENFHPEIIEKTYGNLVLVAKNIRVGFFSYGYPLVKEPVILEKVRLASIEDIGLMKFDALITRGSRKDFYDLFFLARRLPLVDLLDLADKKYSGFRDFPLQALEAMTLFDNADRDFQPELIEELNWEPVKQWFINQTQELGKKWLGL